MQPGKSFFRKSLLCLTLLAIFPGFSWAASSFNADTSGFCCADNSLKESTEKQCKKMRGIYYPSKKKATAQKECRSQKGNVSSKVAIPAKVTMAGFCCANGVVKRATPAQCSKMKGSFYKSSAEARKGCKPPKVFCCVDGKVGEISPGECKKRKGTAYKSAAEAKKKCKPADVYCCIDGKIKKSSPQQCKQQKGTAYTTVAEAKRKCKPADIYCCVNGSVLKMSSKQCSYRKGKASRTRIEADRVCRQEKNSQKNAKLQRMEASAKAKSRQLKPVSGSSSMFAETKSKKKGDRQPVVINRDGKFDTSGALVVMPAGLVAAPGQGNKKPIAQITDRDIAFSGGQTNWSVVRGSVIANPSSTLVLLVGQVAATLVGSPGSESNDRYITAPIENGEYHMLLPPNSNWEVNVLPAMAFNFEELPRGAQVFTYASRSELTRDFTLTYAVEQNIENTQTCRVSGSVMIDGEPAENFSMRVFEAVTQGFSTVSREFPAEGNRFTLFVPSGDYHLKPMFRADSPDFNIVQPKDFTCDFNERRHVIVDFNTNRAQRLGTSTSDGIGLADGVVTSPVGDATSGVNVDLVTIKGRVTVNGQPGYRAILRVRFEKIGTDEKDEVIPDAGGEFRFAVLPNDASYRLSVIVKDGLAYGGEPRILNIGPGSGALNQWHNFDIQFPEFKIDSHLMALRTVVQENGSKRYNFDLKTAASPNPGDQVYSREVTVRTNNSGVAHKRSCDFGTNTTCSFTLPAGQITEADTFLTVTISHELPGASDSSIEIPVTLTGMSDLAVSNLTLVAERPGRGLMASGASTLKDIQLTIKNIGDAPSADICLVRLFINGSFKSGLQLRELDADRHHTLLWRVEELHVGDEITAIISDECDVALGNNRYNHVVQRGEFRYRRN